MATTRNTGRYEHVAIAGESVRAFIPSPLPPTDPPLAQEGAIARRLALAERALAKLNLAGEMIPSLDWFIYAFVRKEAVLSSQIEGTQATLVDLLTFEAADGATPNPDVEDVCNYLDALEFARREISKFDGLPLSLRLLSEAHRRLMNGVRGANKQPGEVRRSQNWIGGSRPGNAIFVPPPPNHVPELLSTLERYVHGEGGPAPLIRTGLVHAQFETIHPYLDGNGRIGRLLIALMLEDRGLLRQPLLYLSLFFKRHQGEYYRRLSAVRTDGDWEGWLDFFLDGVALIAEEATTCATDLFALVSNDRTRVLGGKSASLAASRLFEALPRHPIVTVASAMTLVGVTKPTATRAVGTLVKNGVLAEITGRRRDRAFAYQTYLERLGAEDELPAA